MLQTMEPFFIRSSWSLVTTFLFPKETQSLPFTVMITYIHTHTHTANQVTSASDDDINLANDLIQLDHPESIHAVQCERGGSVTNNKSSVLYCYNRIVGFKWLCNKTSTAWLNMSTQKSLHLFSFLTRPAERRWDQSR